jgi:hypothetical protein
MKADIRLHKTINSYVELVREEGCFSFNGEYSLEVEKKIRSIIKQCIALEERDKNEI